ncbi:hypothetical protein HKX48_001830 [Thoreauomyces humboldtii]|nr:hypothetical protein HKX48_001830 [Thoreauomyces humboldtii]
MDRMLVMIFRSKFLSEKEFDISTNSYKQLADSHISDRFRYWRPYILEWMLRGYKLYEERQFTDIPAACKDWKNGVVNDVNNLEDLLEDIVEPSDDVGDFVTLAQIKERMPKSAKDAFKTLDHLADAVQSTLQLCYPDSSIKYIADSKRNGNKCKHFWTGLVMKTQPSVFE